MLSRTFCPYLHDSTAVAVAVLMNRHPETSSLVSHFRVVEYCSFGDILCKVRDVAADPAITLV